MTSTTRISAHEAATREANAATLRLDHQRRQVVAGSRRRPTAAIRALMAGLAAFGILGLAACGPYQLAEQERTTAELGAREIADRSQADFVGCSGQDSDKDGYVTCTIKDRAAPKAEHELACAYRSRGCKRKT